MYGKIAKSNIRYKYLPATKSFIELTTYEENKAEVLAQLRREQLEKEQKEKEIQEKLKKAFKRKIVKAKKKKAMKRPG